MGGISSLMKDDTDRNLNDLKGSKFDSHSRFSKHPPPQANKVKGLRQESTIQLVCAGSLTGGLRGEGRGHRSACTQEDGRRHEGRAQARGQGKGQGLSSDGIHTEDVETDIVRGGPLSFPDSSCRPAEPDTANSISISEHEERAEKNVSSWLCKHIISTSARK
ncbi:unnamed protein product [Pleuronectes platessa]|uniref:Uncharacterized protein n=1 Tax=Pleuronectes platessa TaxID=8262 RepID=A0A9N7TSB8_PLEPL|nr:unnamed protein product [Pleuronectes platessa]